ncbi:hypothetical protein Sste5346_005435 [Sporothrix stenoceras]|uniref:Uncharacterized protein n=1 Tax=Sporothrix stenoceras TaxID=5173 RepID=A0ABR3Z301_9PEZI
MDDGDGNDGEDRQVHPAFEASLTHSIEELRRIAYEATPRPEDLFSAQRALLRTATARLARKGLSTYTDTYRRLGILIPHWKHPAQFKAVLYGLHEYWKHHNSATSLGRSYPFRKPRKEEKDCALPSATKVRVFRLVNGNLEIPPTLFNALAMAGCIKDAFFPDEPSTWEQGPYGHGLGLGDDNADATTEASFNGTDDVIVIERAEFEEIAPARVDNQVRRATAQFLQQMQAARPANNASNNNGGNPGSGGPFGDMDFSVLPEVIRRMFGFGNNPSPAPPMPMPVPAAQPNFVFCPMPFMVTAMAMGQCGMGQGGMRNMMMQAISIRPEFLIEPSIKNEDDDVSSSPFMTRYDSGSTSSRRTKRTLRSSTDDLTSSSSSGSHQKAKTTSSTTSTSSSSKGSSSAMSAVSSIVQTARRLLPTGRTSSSSSSSAAVASSPRTPLSLAPRTSSSRSAASSAFRAINAPEKRKETFTEYQQKRARHVEIKRQKAARM